MGPSLTQVGGRSGHRLSPWYGSLLVLVLSTSSCSELSYPNDRYGEEREKAFRSGRPRLPSEVQAQ